MSVVTFRVTGSGTGVRQDIEVAGADHVIRTDAYAAFGGKDEYPSPLSFTLASLVSCNQVTAQVVAAELGIVIEHYAFDVSADLDPATLVAGSTSADDTLHNVRLQAIVTTGAPADQVARLASEVERRCPVSALFRRAGTPVISSWHRQLPERD
jgi:putative redox protein